MPETTRTPKWHYEISPPSRRRRRSVSRRERVTQGTRWNSSRVPRAFALCIGVDAVDTSHYRSSGRVWNGNLFGAERHAREVGALFSARGIEPTVVTARDATSESLVAHIGRCARSAVAGDLMVLYFSGHGGFPLIDARRMPVLACFDRMLLAAELHTAFSAFSFGVRVVSLIDACHAGTVFYWGADSGDGARPVDQSYAAHFPGYLDCFYQQHRDVYDAILAALPAAALQTEVLHFGACQDEAAALDAGERGGVFTLAFLDAWNGGAFMGSYRDLYVAIARRTGRQVPTLMSAGPRLPAFVDQPALFV